LNNKDNFISEYINNQIITNNRNVALIDGDIVIYSICCDKKQSIEEIILFGRQEERTLEQVKLEVDNYLYNIITEGGCLYYIGFLSQGSFRYDIAKTKPYKGNRDGRELPKYYKEIKQYLLDDWEFISFKGLEADDLLGIYQNKLVDYNTIIFTIDKDLKQIEGNHYNFRTKQFSSVSEEQGNQMLYKQLLTGDSTDNIKFLAGVGDKTADKILLKSFNNNQLHTVLDYYIEIFGIKKGITLFSECFNLIYILRDKIEGLELAKPISLESIYNVDKDIKNSREDLWGE
jgi:hypothetical protein